MRHLRWMILIFLLFGACALIKVNVYHDVGSAKTQEKPDTSQGKVAP